MIPLFSTKQIRSVDNFAIRKLGVPGILLMENASLEIFNHIKNICKNFTDKLTIGFVCGKGNNGGDGFATARHFVNYGSRVKILFLGNESELSADALTNFKIVKQLSRADGKIKLKRYDKLSDLKFLHDCDIIVDALLGSGTEGDLREPYREIVRRINSLDKFKVAVDLPTGLNADTGYGETIFNADAAITLGELKKGLFFGKGKVVSGRVVKGSIGISNTLFDDYPVEDYLIEPEDVIYNLPKKKIDNHKYSAGKVLTIAGSGRLPGAAKLTAESALKIGAGASVLAFPQSIKSVIQKKILEVVAEPYTDDYKEIYTLQSLNLLRKRFKWMDVLAIGPGLGRDKTTVDAVRETIKLNAGKFVVIDADAVFALGKGYYKKLNLKNMVLTPHHAEFAALIGINLNDLEKDLLAHGKKFSKRNGCYLVLKGAPTIIFSPNGEAFINTCGNPGMAKFGTGDVLTGVIAGLIAQSKDVEKSLINGVYIHSLAADLLVKNFTVYSYSASDILKNLPRAVKFLRQSFA